VACAVVVAQHAFLPWVWELVPPESTLAKVVVYWLLYSGGTGVSVFFVLSAFLLTVSGLRQAEAGRFRAVGFWRQRAVRVLPLYALVVGLLFGVYQPWLGGTAVGGLSFGIIRVFELWPYLTATVNFGLIDLKLRGTTYELTTALPFVVLWSLSVELQFYALFPVLVWLRRWWVGLLVGGVVVCQAFRLYINYTAAVYGYDVNYLHSVSVFQDFGVGCLAGWLYGSAGGQPVRQWLVRRRGWLPLLGVFCLVLWVGVSWQRLLRHEHGLFNVFMWLCDLSLVLDLALAVLMLGWCLAEDTAPADKPRTWLGINWHVPARYTYGVYMWHPAGLVVGYAVLHAAFPIRALTWLGAIVGGVVLGLALAMASWHWLEKPLLDRAKRSTPPADGA
jgi:peptidoglycan/LPS O-acetylase OafA/YrhL